jgi:hypothetical protein
MLSDAIKAGVFHLADQVVPAEFRDQAADAMGASPGVGFVLGF